MPGNKARSKLPPLTWTEGRRLRAWELHKMGWTNSSIADALGVFEPAVCHWIKLARARGAAPLYRRRPRGKRARLSKAQLRIIPKLLAKGAEQFGLSDTFSGCLA